MAETDKKTQTETPDAPETDAQTDQPQTERPVTQGSDFLNHKEAEATGEHYNLTPEEEKSRKRRSLAIALGVVAFILLVYFITMLRLAQNVGGTS